MASSLCECINLSKRSQNSPRPPLRTMFNSWLSLTRRGKGSHTDTKDHVSSCAFHRIFVASFILFPVQLLEYWHVNCLCDMMSDVVDGWMIVISRWMMLFQIPRSRSNFGGLPIMSRAVGIVRLTETAIYHYSIYACRSQPVLGYTTLAYMSTNAFFYLPSSWCNVADNALTIRHGETKLTRSWPRLHFTTILITPIVTGCKTLARYPEHSTRSSVPLVSYRFLTLGYKPLADISVPNEENLTQTIERFLSSNDPAVRVAAVRTLHDIIYDESVHMEARRVSWHSLFGQTKADI